MNFEIGRSRDFVVEHCYSCAVPGYLIVSPLITVESLDALPRQSAENLGPLLANVTSLVKETVNPLRIYCVQFGEEQSQLHFHIFPRGAAEAFRSNAPAWYLYTEFASRLYEKLGWHYMERCDYKGVTVDVMCKRIES